MTTTIGIIGTAGSRNDMKYFNKESFEKLVKYIEKKIIWDEDIELWSGGSSGIDHICVILALKYKCKVKLFLPSKFENESFYDNGEYSYTKNTGKQLNQLHKKFSQKVDINSLEQINTLIHQNNCEIKVYNGFHRRNDEVAKADIILAITESDIPDDGGTKYTWDKAKNSDRHSYNIHKILSK